MLCEFAVMAADRTRGFIASGFGGAQKPGDTSSSRFWRQISPGKFATGRLSGALCGVTKATSLCSWRCEGNAGAARSADTWVGPARFLCFGLMRLVILVGPVVQTMKAGMFATTKRLKIAQCVVRPVVVAMMDIQPSDVHSGPFSDRAVAATVTPRGVIRSGTCDDPHVMSLAKASAWIHMFSTTAGALIGFHT